MAEEKEPKNIYEFIEKYKLDKEKIEKGSDNVGNFVESETGFPKPVKSYRFVLEDFNKSAEEIYHWLMDNIEESEGFPNVEKVQDIFSATEQSSFWGNVQQRLGMQQEKVSMYLGYIGKMVKELFQIVRELRIIDERLGYYDDSYDKNSNSRESAEIVLKGIWIDQVEQGAKNPASVYGMARELQFTTLPDLFFSINPTSISEVDSEVEKLQEYNRKLREVLKRKLRNFMQWKESTYYETKNRRRFTLRYLRQHYNIIKMYNSWLKPYLNNLKRLTMSDRTKDPGMVSAFEGSMVEVENVFYKKPPSHGESKAMKWNQHINAVIILSIRHRTKPQMNFMTEYQRGPLHVGKAEITLRAYTWEDEVIKDYVRARENEDMQMVTEVDGSIKAAMDSLGEELERYLREAGEEGEVEYEKQPPEGEKKKSSLEEWRKKDPFVAVMYGFKEAFYDPFKGKSKGRGGKKEPDPMKIEFEKKVAESNAIRSTWQVYKNFKKNHGMLAW
ncbi:MAG: hypothetical protein ACOCQG_01410 [Candidatus Nanoarchaeia archaeon]